MHHRHEFVPTTTLKEHKEHWNAVYNSGCTSSVAGVPSHSKHQLMSSVQDQEVNESLQNHGSVLGFDHLSILF
jgi:hypothetical protein